jgi:hypothetical protein
MEKRKEETKNWRWVNHPLYKTKVKVSDQGEFKRMRNFGGFDRLELVEGVDRNGAKAMMVGLTRRPLNSTNPGHSYMFVAAELVLATFDPQPKRKWIVVGYVNRRKWRDISVANLKWVQKHEHARSSSL